MAGTSHAVGESHERQTRVSWRAVLIGLLLLVPNAFWVVYMETILYLAHSTGFSLFFHAVFNLALLLALNVLLRQVSPSLALGQGEHVTI